MAEATKQPEQWAVIAVHPSLVATIVAVVEGQEAAKQKRLELYKHSIQGGMKILKLPAPSPADPVQTEVSAVRKRPNQPVRTARKKGGDDDGK